MVPPNSGMPEIMEIYADRDSNNIARLIDE